MQLRPIIIVVMLTISCKTPSAEWQTLDFGAFTLTTPQGWTKVKSQGIDSYVGGLTKGKDTIWFDYGWYGVDLSGEEYYTHRFANDTVNGLYANFTIPDTAGKGYISMNIPKVTGMNTFTIWGTHMKATDTILKIYKSIVFKNSDTSKNPPLTLSKFVYKANGSARSLFYDNCASCHSIHKTILTPPLGEIISKRSSDWVYTFLTDRKNIKTDSSYQAPGGNEALHCREFPNLTGDDVTLIVDYIKSN